MKKAAILSMLLLFSALSIGCNTMHGLGEDIEKGGEAIKEASQ